MNLTIRQAIESDIPRVEKLYADWVQSGVTLGLVEPQADHFQASLGSLFLVAEHDGTIVGFAIGTEHTSDGLAVISKGERYVEVDDIYVMPEHQRAGVGVRLIEEMEHRAKANGISRFLIYSASRDINGIMNFYRTLGYKPWCVQMYK